MELLEYQEASTFAISSSESEEDFQIMNTYFSLHGSEDLSYTHEVIDYDIKNQSQYVYGSNFDENQSSNFGAQQDYQYIPQHNLITSGQVPQQIGHQINQQQQPLPPFGQYQQHQPHLIMNQIPPPQLRVAGTTSGVSSLGANALHSSPVFSLPSSTQTEEERRRVLYSPKQMKPQIPVNMQEYPDMTTMVNSNQNLVVPMVDTTFVDLRTCTICNKRINRDMTRHMRTHQMIPRFQCPFPRLECNHKTGRFNRPYDYKKHLLNRHFRFDNPNIKRLHTLSDKLDHTGACSCGARYVGRDWLDKHILTEDISKRCAHIDTIQR